MNSLARCMEAIRDQSIEIDRLKSALREIRDMNTHHQFGYESFVKDVQEIAKDALKEEK